MSRYQLINTLRATETRFLRTKIKNSFFQRRNRAKRAGTATAEFVAEIKQAFDDRIDRETHNINQVCDNLIADDELEVPEFLVARGKGRRGDHIILSQVIPVVGHNLSGKRCRSDDHPPEDTSAPVKRAKVDEPAPVVPVVPVDPSAPVAPSALDDLWEISSIPSMALSILDNSAQPDHTCFVSASDNWFETMSEAPAPAIAPVGRAIATCAADNEEIDILEGLDIDFED